MSTVVVGHWLSCLFFGIGSIDEALVPAADRMFDPGIDDTGALNVGWVLRHFVSTHNPPGLHLDFQGDF